MRAWTAITIRANWRLLEDFFAPVFEDRFHLLRELVAQRAVDQAMVEGERQVAHRTDGDGVVEHHWNLLDGPDAQNGHLRLVDDRRREHAAEAAKVGNGEGPGLNL